MARARGQSTVELLATVPALLALLLGGAQGVALAWTLVEAADAARAGARAAAMGGDGAVVSRRSLPASLRPHADVVLARGQLVVRVQAPRLLPAVPLDVAAAAAR
jgi:hypothetical protein